MYSSILIDQISRAFFCRFLTGRFSSDKMHQTEQQTTTFQGFDKSCGIRITFPWSQFTDMRFRLMLHLHPRWFDFKDFKMICNPEEDLSLRSCYSVCRVSLFVSHSSNFEDSSAMFCWFYVFLHVFYHCSRFSMLPLLREIFDTSPSCVVYLIKCFEKISWSLKEKYMCSIIKLPWYVSRD